MGRGSFRRQRRPRPVKCMTTHNRPSADSVHEGVPARCGNGQRGAAVPLAALTHYYGNSTHSTPAPKPSLRHARPADSMATESRILSSVCQLTRLRSLHLTTNVPARACGLAAVAPHAQTLTQLSALTSLTSLDLVLPACYRPVADRWSRWKFREKDCQAWQALWSTQRSSLLLALRRMPGLEHLGCRDLWMDPSELVPLTALTSLTLGGLMPLSQPELPPSEGMAPWSLPAQGMADWALPQQLQELHLADGASPSILRLLQLPPSLRRIRASALCFGMYDTAEGVVLPRAVQAVGTAVRLLVRHAGNVDPSFIVAADCGPDPMEPSEEGAVSHTEWISHLAGLSPAVTKLEIRHVQLRVGDVACLASALPHLKVGSRHVCRCLVSLVGAGRGCKHVRLRVQGAWRVRNYRTPPWTAPCRQQSCCQVLAVLRARLVRFGSLVSGGLWPCATGCRVAAPCQPTPLCSDTRPHLPDGINWNIRRLTCTASCLDSRLRVPLCAQKLVLKCTHVPMSALFALTSLQQLAEVHLDLSHFSYIAEEELVGLLSLLIRQVRALGAVEVAVTAAAHQEGLEHFFSSVQEQLEAWGINDAKRMTVFVMT